MLHQLLQLGCELVAVLRSVQAGVVAHMNGGVAQRGGDSLAVIDHLAVFLGVPLQVVHAQAVDQHQRLAARAGQARRARLDVPLQRLALVAQAHRRGQRVAAGHQVVAHHAVQDGQHGFALRAAGLRGAGGFEQRHQRGKRQVERLAHRLRDAVDALVDQPGHAPRLPGGGPAGHAHGVVDGLVHALDDAGHALGGLGGQLGHAAQVGGTQVAQCVFRRGFLGHGVAVAEQEPGSTDHFQQEMALRLESGPQSRGVPPAPRRLTPAPQNRSCGAR